MQSFNRNEFTLLPPSITTIVKTIIVYCLVHIFGVRAAVVVVVAMFRQHSGWLLQCFCLSHRRGCTLQPDHRRGTNTLLPFIHLSCTIYMVCLFVSFCRAVYVCVFTTKASNKQ